MFRRTFVASLAAPCSSLAGPASLALPVIERAWFGPADRAHGHDALGIGNYPGSVHTIVLDRGRRQAVHLEIEGDAAFEDGLIRLVDLDADGSPEFMVVVASRLAGAAITVLGVERRDGALVLLERARSPSVGPGRWLNPVGMADFQGNGQQDVVAVVTTRNGHQCVAIPNQTRRRLRFLAPTLRGGWVAVAPDAVFDHPIQSVRSVEGNRLQVQAGTKYWLLR